MHEVTNETVHGFTCVKQKLVRIIDSDNHSLRKENIRIIYDSTESPLTKILNYHLALM